MVSAWQIATYSLSMSPNFGNFYFSRWKTWHCRSVWTWRLKSAYTLPRLSIPPGCSTCHALPPPRLCSCGKGTCALIYGPNSWRNLCTSVQASDSLCYFRLRGDASKTCAMELEVKTHRTVLMVAFAAAKQKRGDDENWKRNSNRAQLSCIKWETNTD